MNISNFLPKITDFKVLPKGNLFGPDWQLLKALRCPLCGLKLKAIQRNDLWICKNKKIKCKFVIRRTKLIEKMV